MKRVLVSLWLLIPCFALSALLVSTDDDVGSLGALASPEMLSWVAVWSLPFILGGAIGLAGLSGGGLRGFFKYALVSSGALGLLIAAAGGSAVTPLGIAWSVVGSALAVFVFLAVAVLPSLVAASYRALRTPEAP